MFESDSQCHSLGHCIWLSMKSTGEKYEKIHIRNANGQLLPFCYCICDRIVAYGNVSVPYMIVAHGVTLTLKEGTEHYVTLFKPSLQSQGNMTV